MWFKNVQLFHLTEDFEYDAEQLAEKLAERPFRACQSTQLSSIGWISPLGEDHDQLVMSADGALALSACHEVKVLPASVVSRKAKERIKAEEARTGAKLKKQQKDEIRQDVLFELLPKAFTKLTTTQLLIDPKKGWIIVDAASRKKAEEILSLLRETLESLPVKPPETEQHVGSTMTDWLKYDAPQGFELEGDCELKEQGAPGVIRIKAQDLLSQEIRAHIEGGMQVTKLALTWSGAYAEPRLSFVLDYDLSIKSLKFLDNVALEMDEVDIDSLEMEYDTRLSIMTGEFRILIPEVLKQFGG